MSETGKKTVLIVEDSDKNMKLAAEHLSDLVLLDIQMPDIDGVEARGRLCAAP